MQFFIEPVRVNNNPVDMMKPETLMAVAPDYYGPRLDAIAELRAQDDGSLHKKNEFRRVASLVNVPLMMARKLVDPGFLRDKKAFYAWLDSGNNRAYCTYQRPDIAARRAQVQRDTGHVKLKDLGVDYEGAPETIENWDPVEFDLEPKEADEKPVL